MKVFGFHDGHACGRYRILLPFDQLQKHGHDVDVNWGWHDRCEDYRIIVGQRVGKPEALPIWRRLKAKHRLVYETDDDVFTIDPTNAQAYLAHSPEIVDAVEFAAAAADLVTVSTEPLAQVMRRYNDNVVVLPNHIEAALLDVQRPRRERVTIGWGGGDSHLVDFAAVADQLRRFLHRNPQVDFHNIGTSYLRPFKLPGRHTGWSADMWDYYRSIDFDIGIAPLADTVFNRSKSAIRAIEYGALGIPVVASNVEAYREIIVDGVTGYLITHEHQWASRLRELVNDEAMRVEMGAKARQHVSAWAIEKGWRAWETAYAQLT